MLSPILTHWSNTVTEKNCKPESLHRILSGACLLLSTFLFSTESYAGNADVIDAKADCESNRICRFSVTLKHADTGWDHYADKWEILTMAGDSLGTRVLLHPHVNEQPFTRSLGNVRVPEDVDRVVIRGHDSVHGFGGKTIEVRIIAE